ncbi:MAG: hypothetical protein AUK44_02150 [Porphyromonadaceae bacterium CG2_30_38_12]|nr:MAG: hypothetical protein AUK44_02150 [Porphyromonadaceae bacterium CG2_30_38_12]
MKNIAFQNKNSDFTNIEAIFTKYLGGNASQQELSILEDWISASLEHEAEFFRISKLYEFTGNAAGIYPTFNIDKAKSAFEKYTFANSNPRKHISLSSRALFFRSVAAVAILVVSVMLFWNQFAFKTIQVQAANVPVHKTLPDGTQVALAANSAIAYTSDFAKKTKVLSLQGTADFKVGKSGNGKLRLAAGETIIEDIGTVFNVSAMPQSNEVLVHVKEGMVRFYTSDNKGIVLKKNESGKYDKSLKLFSYLARCQSNRGVDVIILNLENVSLTQAAATIATAYKANIQLVESSLNEKQITVSFNNESLDTVLQILSKTLALELSKKQGIYYLKAIK